MIARNSISDRGIKEEKKSRVKSEAVVVEQADSPRSTTTTRKSSKKQKKPRRPSKGLGRRNLGTDFTPGPWDVICARGLKAWNHPGNRKLRAMIEAKNIMYSEAQTKLQRTAVVTDIVETFRGKGAGFVRQEESSCCAGGGVGAGGGGNDADNEGGEWFEVGDRLSREKVGQMLRESLGGKYRSSATAKKRRREIIAKWDSDYLTKSNSEVSQILSNVNTKMKQSDEQTPLSDQDVLQLFNQTNTNLLDALKRDATLVQSFQDAMPKDDTTMCSSSCTSDVDDDDMSHNVFSRRNSTNDANLKSSSSFEEEGSSSRTSILILDDDDDITTMSMNNPQEYPV